MCSTTLLFLIKKLLETSEKKKHNIERRLQGIQCSLERVDSVRLIYLQRDLQKEYDEILAQEEIHWYQKATVDYIKIADRNTMAFIMRMCCMSGCVAVYMVLIFLLSWLRVSGCGARKTVYALQMRLFLPTA